MVAPVSSLLPSNRTAFEENLEEAVSRPLPDLINRLWNPDTCPAEFLGYLAWGLAVLEWDDNWSELAKREVIRESIAVHQHQGTPGALKNALLAMGYHLVEILDVAVNVYNGKSDYNGAIAYGEYMPAFMFDVILHTAEPITAQETLLIKDRIALYKNARSHLRNLRLMTILYNNTFTYDGIQTYNGGII